MSRASPRDLLMREWLPVIRRTRLTSEIVLRALDRASANGTGFVVELLASGEIDEAVLFRAIADELDLPFLSEIDAKRLKVPERYRLAALRRPRGLPLALLERPDGTTLHVIATPDVGISLMRARLAASPHLKTRLAVSPPGVLRTAILELTKRRLVEDAQNGLFLRHTDLSARIVANAWQGACVATILVVLPLCLAVAAMETILALHLVATLAFGACVALRILALTAAQPLRLRPPPPVDPSALPVYSVMVALYREREVIPQLLVALGRLQWPRSKLEIKLVCEEDDHETLAALREHKLRPCIEIITVPPGLPRTKPKALAYALPLCSGEFVTLFDAEDRPHPHQLIEAWQRFHAEDDTLACLQAPLVITNASASPLSRMFAFEYAGLFRGVLPWLAGLGTLLPLGGTSNHFRRSALVDAGGWDAYNVTEDADLGLRLKRFGYRVGVITHPTYEDGPDDLKTWLPQRVRWFKGWAQTWLVHMRSPHTLWKDLGPLSFLLMQVLFLGMLVSALVHPVFLLTILYVIAKLAWVGSMQNLEIVLVTIGFVNILAGYAAFVAIGMATLTLKEKVGLVSIALQTPFHWMRLSLAAWLALWEIYRRPHHWNKTQHRPARSLVRARAENPQRKAEEGAPMILSSSAPITSRSRPA
ncbi:glycosyltransferase family 2 protein [Neoaquamicrobium sediminum]|uniref:glycosyltransferase family 2 protein n=1 Tax=Neoaquamicrobium sediminum TaxID=1849104 RepID=UPI0015638E2E|nr:glycosyltransferase family 2 protein [Mesorhizobium sediminum]NRC52797.1 glycosyltransferase [Mesorhizobium sediminum]